MLDFRHDADKLKNLIDAGTAGVWRISALNEAGGWKDRTTVEDMDLAVRASLKGWKFVYVGALKVWFITHMRTCFIPKHFVGKPS